MPTFLFILIFEQERKTARTHPNEIEAMHIRLIVYLKGGQRSCDAYFSSKPKVFNVKLGVNIQIYDSHCRVSLKENDVKIDFLKSQKVKTNHFNLICNADSFILEPPTLTVLTLKRENFYVESIKNDLNLVSTENCEFMLCK